jgi:hypothetical protein
MCTTLSSRTSLLILNTIFFFLGGGILAVGLWSQYDRNFATLWNSFEVSKVIDARALNGAGLLLIISGFSSLAVSFVGLYGAFKKDRCFLTTYCLLVCVILVLEVASASVFISYQSQSREKLELGLNKTVEKINADNDTMSLKVMDSIQTVFQCCGCEGPDDYKNLTQMHSCETKLSTPILPLYFQNGCYPTIINYIAYHLPIIVSLSLGMIVFQLFLMIVSIKACTSIRHEGYMDI